MLPDDEHDLLTPKEVADIFGVRTATVARWARGGLLPVAGRTPGGHRRFRRTDINALKQDPPNGRRPP